MLLQRRNEWFEVKGTETGNHLPELEVKLSGVESSSVRVSTRAATASAAIAPVSLREAREAACLLRELLLSMPARTVLTQANADRERVQLLLSEEE